jgi:aspartyl-tRNA(Asn)/glutamyl-tRNA(Gln) amidotransferase subunit A
VTGPDLGVRELWRYSAAESGAALRAGRVSPPQLLEACLERLAATSALNAVCFADRDGARRAAQQSAGRYRAGRALSPVDGVPVVVKDNLFVGGLPATWGSRRWRGFVPERDDICAERLRAAGAVIVGKTNTPELAMSSNTDNLVFGVTRNPHDLRLTPGGSSGGTAAAVAAGVVPFGLGTDSGGSIRAPASLSGLYGLRPTNGRVPRAFGFPPLALDFQVIGRMARTLEDMTAYFGVLAGADVRDPASLLTPAHPALQAPRVGWFASVDGAAAEAQAIEHLDAAAGALAAAGLAVAQVRAPYALAPISEIWGVLVSAGVAAAQETAPQPGEQLTDGIAGLAAGAAGISGVEYCRTVSAVTATRRAISAAWPDADVLLTPALPTAAWPAGLGAPPEIAGQAAAPGAVSAFLQWVNLMGYPAICVPAGRYRDGRPCGVQLVARPGHERTLFAVAAALDSALAVDHAPVFAGAL